MERVLSPVQNLMINFAPYVGKDASVTNETELNLYYADIVSNATELNNKLSPKSKKDIAVKLWDTYRQCMLLSEFYENKYTTTKNKEYKERVLYFKNKANSCIDKFYELTI